MAKLRILHCLETVGSGGVEQRRLLLARKLDPDIYEQQLVCTQTVGPVADQMRKAGMKVDAVGLFPKGILTPSPYRNTLSVIRKFKPHIIHGAVFEGVALAALTGRLARVPIVIAEETSDPQTRSWRGHLLYRMLLRLSDKAVAVSPAVQSYLYSLGLNRTKAQLICNGVEERPLPDNQEVASLRTSVGFEENDIIVGTIGRLYDDHKRVSDLIRALSVLSNDIPKLKLLVVGDGPDLCMLKGLVTELKLVGRVVFAGYQSDTRPWYALMDVFALASSREAFGLVLVEAMYARLPIVATRVGGIPNIVVDNETGYLVEAHKPVEIANALSKLAYDEKLRAKFGEAGLDRARLNFSADRYVSEVNDLYQSLSNMKDW